VTLPSRRRAATLETKKPPAATALPGAYDYQAIRGGCGSLSSTGDFEKSLKPIRPRKRSGPMSFLQYQRSFLRPPELGPRHLDFENHHVLDSVAVTPDGMDRGPCRAAGAVQPDDFFLAFRFAAQKTVFVDGGQFC
jgi:hypothetical protein